MPSGSSRLRWAATAERDVREIWAYYALEASTDAANKIVALIRAVATRVGEHPFSGRPRDEVRLGLRSTLAHPYVIFYRILDDGVQIARVVHQSRDLRSVLSKEE